MFMNWLCQLRLCSTCDLFVSIYSIGWTNIQHLGLQSNHTISFMWTMYLTHNVLNTDNVLHKDFRNPVPHPTYTHSGSAHQAVWYLGLQSIFIVLHIKIHSVHQIDWVSNTDSLHTNIWQIFYNYTVLDKDPCRLHKNLRNQMEQGLWGHARSQSTVPLSTTHLG